MWVGARRRPRAAGPMMMFCSTHTLDAQGRRRAPPAERGRLRAVAILLQGDVAKSEGKENRPGWSKRLARYNPAAVGVCQHYHANHYRVNRPVNHFPST